MASFFQPLIRLVFKGRQKEGYLGDEEKASGAGSNPPSATLGGHLMNPTRHRLTDDDPLTLFRLMMGISAPPSLGFSKESPIGSRPATNIGLYARIVYSEQQANDSFKVFSIVINACYFLQIIVAAALTAMGAASASNKAITAFGAINTVIAGFLTFLKGSGLPQRLKYYGNEWKKIREVIEQRERDLSRQGCNLNVHDIVKEIEEMYASTKREIEMNTPDSYNSVRGGGINVSKIDEVISSKLKGMDGAAQQLKAGIDKETHGIQDAAQLVQDDGKTAKARIFGLGKAVMADIQQMSHTVDGAEREVISKVGETTSRAATEVRQASDSALEEGRAGVALRVRITPDGSDP